MSQDTDIVRKLEDLEERTNTLLSIISDILLEFDEIKSPRLQAYLAVLKAEDEDEIADAISAQLKKTLIDIGKGGH